MPRRRRRSLLNQTEVKDVIGRQANEQMIEGYLDGYDLDAPEPSTNRSHSYRHGFANGRDDRRGKPRANYQELIGMADAAMAADEWGRGPN